MVKWFLILLSCLPLLASEPRLEWDASFDPNVTGYRVYFGDTSRGYTNMIDVGLQTFIPLTNANLPLVTYMAVTAYDVNQIESPMSEEVWYTPGNRVPIIRIKPPFGVPGVIEESDDLITWGFLKRIQVTGITYTFPCNPVLSQKFYRFRAE